MTKAGAVVAIGFLMVASAPADTWHVDNRAGDDANDGRSEKRAFATIARAVKAAKTSDTIVLANTGSAYREAIALSGLGGTPAEPFIIEGNGAVVTGLRALPATGWKQAGEGVWLYAVEKKPYGNPFLVQAGRRLTQAKSAEAVEAGQFFWDDKGVRFRPEAGKTIGDTALEATLLDSGVALGGASYVVCRNIVSEYHSNDGFNIHGDCRGVVFENIVARNNGDDGFSIHECGGAVVRNGWFHHNRWGIQDVNASRSIFNGVTCEENEANGADFVGGYHSLVDCVVRNNGAAQVNVRGERPKHLVGGESDPLCEGVAFLQNVLIAGGPEGLRVGGTARVTARNCLITQAGTGAVVRDQSVCLLSSSIVAQCQKLELDCTSQSFFRDHNLYHPGRFRWQGKDFGPEQWDAFRAAAGHDATSLLADPTLAANGVPAPDSPALKAKPRIGPTQPVTGYQPTPPMKEKP
ncbi:MAG TPA: right-handed parallel beta-helix repeat-containing protein [Planctomycetota bacterium]|nr:right-handed parallel beta-helix repeat-containing protein [Planctomycetota bacterium]